MLIIVSTPLLTCGATGYSPVLGAVAMYPAKDVASQPTEQRMVNWTKEQVR